MRPMSSCQFRRWGKGGHAYSACRCHEDLLARRAAHGLEAARRKKSHCRTEEAYTQEEIKRGENRAPRPRDLLVRDSFAADHLEGGHREDPKVKSK